MFCNNCGASVAEGSKFCLECGAQLQAAAGQASPPPLVSSSQNEEERRKKGGGFFSSPAGIALVVILGLALIAGVTLGIIFLVRGNDNNTVDAETVRVWDEYDSILTEDSTDIAQINMDPNALAQTQADLKKTQDRVTALEKVLKDNAGTSQRRQGTVRRANNARDIKVDQMAAALAAYNLYIQKMNQLFGTLIGANLLDPNVVNTLNAVLRELQGLATDVRTLTNRFLADNNRIAVVKFDPPILKVAAVFAPEVEKNIAAAQAAEQQRLAADQAAADQAAAAAAAQQAAQQQQNQMVTCPNCGGVGTVEGGDGRYTCGFCNGAGIVTRARAANYNPSDWRDY